jgi:uncharacterized membrane protein HdeD (DUF308 family)
VRRSFRWLTVTIGLLCTTVGALLTVSPFASMAVLVALALAGLILAGATELAQARTAAKARPLVRTGLGWLVAAAGVAAWPGVTIRVLALAIGVALIVDGIVAAVPALRYQAGADTLLLGTASVVLGVVALSWPTATVFVVSSLLGVRLV